MTDSDATVEYGALTVAQLKALCKARKIAGYSKLAKAALVQKLQAVGPLAIPSTTSTGDQRATTSGDQLATTSGDKRTGNSGDPHSGARPVPKPAPRKSASRACAPAEAQLHSVSNAEAHSIDNTQRIHPGSLTRSPLPSKRPPSPIPTPASKKQRLSKEITRPLTSDRLGTTLTGLSSPSTHRNAAPVPGASKLSIDAPVLVPSNKRPPKSTSASKKQLSKESVPEPVELATPVARPESSQLPSTSTHRIAVRAPEPSQLPTVAPVLVPPASAMPKPSPTTLADTTNSVPSMKAAPKRFKPLVAVTSRPTAMSKSSLGDSVVGRTTPASSALDLSYFLFPSASAATKLALITLPPSLAQRKNVDAWSIILSGLSDRERNQCVHVSRMFRYAVYLSASVILRASFAGARLAAVAAQYPQNRTDMFPYLRERAREVRARRAVFAASFLGRRVYVPGDPLAARLWTSPDHPGQVAIAVRFLLTRLWFWLSLPSPGAGYEGERAARPWLDETVVDAREIVAGEIWAVAVRSARSGVVQTFYVLEATCEVVGHADASVRADWSAYIAEADAATPLLDRLQWAHRAEYEKGVSMLWLRRTGEDESGQVKRTVAQRYVLASVIANSVSGGWMSCTEMAQDAAPGGAQAKAPRVNLFLPAHHHVESVHLHTSARVPLHPAVAVVQTPGREYFVLRENGMQIGCEEDGVAEVWQRVLGCDGVGVSIPGV